MPGKSLLFFGIAFLLLLFISAGVQAGACSDGADNDKDGYIDKYDADCYASSVYASDKEESGITGPNSCAPIEDNCVMNTYDGMARQLKQEILSNITDCESSEKIVQKIRDTPAGETAVLPGGCFKINEQIVIDKVITIVGQGVKETILVRDNESTAYNGRIFHVSTDSDELVRITGISFVGLRDDDSEKDSGIIIISKKNFRVDNCFVTGFGGAGIAVFGDSRGVIDHCTIIDNWKSSDGYGVVVSKGSWEPEMNLGTDKATFIEDNIIVGSSHAVTSNAGAHYVSRNNIILENRIGWGIDAHGLCCGSDRGTRAVEIYNNIVKDSPDGHHSINIRGGGGVIFGNMLLDEEQPPIILTLETGDLTPGVDSSVRGECPWLDQINDLWIWGNHNESGSAGARLSEYGPINEKNKECIQVGREYHLEEKPGYAPYIYPHPLTKKTCIQGTDNDNDGFCDYEDCNDGDASINPYSFEICDSIDNDCDGETDEGITCMQPCGNGTCETGETFATCPQDCPECIEDITPYIYRWKRGEISMLALMQKMQQWKAGANCPE